MAPGTENKGNVKVDEKKMEIDRSPHGGNPKFRNDRGGQGSHGGHGGGGGGRGRRNRGPHGGGSAGHNTSVQHQNIQQSESGSGRPNMATAVAATPDKEGEEGETQQEKKFTGRCRLFVGNLPNDCKEEDFKKMFQQFGEFTEVYVNTQRGFGFIRMDTRQNAESAKSALDGLMKKGRMLRVRFATHGAALRIKYLPSCVTNELLEQAFQQFGEVERAIVTVDDRGKPTGEGIVEFARKPGAVAALKRIREGVFLMSTTPRPIQAEVLEQLDEVDGYPEKFVQKNQEFLKEREQPPRFARMGTFEFEYGRKWQQMYVRHQEEEENLKRQFEDNGSKLELDMANAYMEHQTQMLREDLMKRQEELRRLEEAHQVEIARRMEMRKQEEDRRRQEEERRHMEIQMRQDEQRRQQELYMQQERAMREMSRERRGGNAPPMPPPPAPPVSMGIERGRPSQAMGSRDRMRLSSVQQGVTSIGNGQEGGQESNIGMGSGAGGNVTMLMQGMGSQSSPTLEQQSQPQSGAMRQSRFDQPPGFQSQMGSMGGGNPGNHGNMMGGNGMPGGSAAHMGRSHMTSERMESRMEARGRDRPGGPDDYFDNKRARRY